MMIAAALAMPGSCRLFCLMVGAAIGRQYSTPYATGPSPIYYGVATGQMVDYGDPAIFGPIFSRCW
ncbi:hypothetical protein ACNKHL_18740 [Shigella flexneri]